MKYTRVGAMVLAMMLCTAVLLPAQAIYCNYYNANGNHNWKDAYVKTASTCTQNGVMCIECKECGELGIRVMDKLSHDYNEWKVTRQPTDCLMGEAYRECRICGYADIQDFWPDGTVHQHTQNTNAIRSLQELLVQAGYLQVVNGVYDAATEQAVRTVQIEAGFNANGIAWPQTISYLQQLTGQPANTVTAPSVENTPVVTGVEQPQQQAYCYRTDISGSMTAMVYCAKHQELNESYEMMMSVAQTDALKVEVLRMYRLVLEKDLEDQYAAWQKGATSEIKLVATSHQSMSAKYLTMQELSWKIIYGESDMRVLENVLDALMQQCAELCLMIAQSTNVK